MGLLDGIEKLINEHGSATILKERIALAEDKHAALERRLSESEVRVKQLESEKQAVESDNLELKEKVRGLVAQLDERHGQRLEEIREKILTVLSSGLEYTSLQISAVLSVGEQLATFHLEELAKTRLVSASKFYTGQPTIWRLAQDGRGYLVNHGLLT